MKNRCLISHKKTGELALSGVRKGRLFVADLDPTNKEKVCCFYTKASSEESMLWYRKLSHLNFKAINSLVKREMLRDIPTLEFKQEEIYEACQRERSKDQVISQRNLVQSLLPYNSFTWISLVL